MRQKMNLAVVLLSSLSLQGPSHNSYNLQFCSHLEAFAPCVWNTLSQSLQGQFFFFFPSIIQRSVSISLLRHFS